MHPSPAAIAVSVGQAGSPPSPRAARQGPERFPPFLHRAESRKAMRLQNYPPCCKARKARAGSPGLFCFSTEAIPGFSNALTRKARFAIDFNLQLLAASKNDGTSLCHTQAIAGCSFSAACQSGEPVNDFGRGAVDVVTCYVNLVVRQHEPVDDSVRQPNIVLEPPGVGQVVA